MLDKDERSGLSCHLVLLG